MNSFLASHACELCALDASIGYIKDSVDVGSFVRKCKAVATRNPPENAVKAWPGVLTQLLVERNLVDKSVAEHMNNEASNLGRRGVSDGRTLASLAVAHVMLDDASKC